MRKLLFIFAMIGCVSQQISAQDILSLEECIEIGIENNLALQTKRNEIRKGQYALSENRARLLPAINGFAGFTDNIKPPVSVTDGSSYGVPYNVTKTLPYSANAGIQLQLPLYNQTLYTSMDVARIMDQLNRLGYEKAREELMMEISKLYYLGQTTNEQLEILKNNIGRLEELKNITEAFYDNGMAMDIDVKRVRINLDNMKVQYDNAQAMLVQQMNLLKYMMDYPMEKNFALERVQAEKLSHTELTGLSENLYEIQMLESQKTLAEKQRKLIRNGYIPSLSLSGNLSTSAFTDKVRYWFQDNPSSKWYTSYGVGVSLRVPIFDGLEKRNKVRKAEMDIENARLNLENTRKNLQTKYLNATNDLMNSERNFFKQKDNYLLAEDVYAVTIDRYKEGIASMTEVLQDEMRMSEAQNNYITAHYNYQLNNLVLLKLTGNIESLIK
ncbi:TolC family protein [Bacteroides sp. OF04-15BH]|uniref:TolC family protein n=1 Tax=Bacteroides sp. OF04-15BH TaxID=2292281 RepID=UPI000E4ED80B|nr:TolC family protein [Bacteroides sp. OF04-15BH]RHP65956.1 TolC family protein [Bacteroides sp. OF04-15BH]